MVVPARMGHPGRAALAGRPVSGGRSSSRLLVSIGTPTAPARPLSLACHSSAEGPKGIRGMSPSASQKAEPKKPKKQGKKSSRASAASVATLSPKPASAPAAQEEADDSAQAGKTLPTVVPEDFKLEPGELSFINKSAPIKPLDVFRCQGCLDPACHGPSGCADSARRVQGGYLKKILTAQVYDVAVESPLDPTPRLSDRTKNTILLKREDMQPVFSFKLRGAYNKMAHMTEDELRSGVICSSAGNHAQGTALSAQRLGCSAVIAMPETTPSIKVQSVRRLGGEVVLVGETYDATQAYAQARAVEEGRVFVPPFDDPLVIAGQGTIGMEILRQCPGDLHAVFVPIGGGGLLAGVAALIKQLRPEVKVFGVEPCGANAMAQSLARGERVQLSRVDAFADGVAVKVVGAECFRICKETCDGVVLADTDSICAAIKDVFEDTRSILEPAGALALAGAKDYLKRNKLEGETVVAITSGANMNFDKLRLVSELADVGQQKEAVLATTIKEVPGSFRELCSAIGDMSITEFKYRQSSEEEAHILWSVATKSGEELDSLLRRIEGVGMPTTNLSENSLVKMHLRHLVGGPSAIAGEMLFQFEFPERAGALMKFLSCTSPRWNITLFHYRYSGSRLAQVLIGLQVGGADDMQELTDALVALGYPYKPVDGDAMEFFQNFMRGNGGV